MNDTVIIILAAGSSSRMEEPKQLLVYNNQSLLSYIINEAQKSLMPVIVVLGAKEQKIKTAIKSQNVEIAINQTWQSGMSSSIKAGLKKALEMEKEMQNCILAVCDQPYVSSVLFTELVKQKIKTEKKIITCSYANTLGTPCLFDKRYFDELMNLEGGYGAKKLLLKYADDVASVSFEKGKIDVDTKKDYEELLKNKNL